MSDTAQIFAVAGHPVLHSKSPFLFNRAFRDSGEQAVYTRISAASASEASALFAGIGLSGLNVTTPFKQTIIENLDELDSAAAAIGAVNTVVEAHGQLTGHNTDHVGVTGALQAQGLRLPGRQCLVLGAGGAGRAAAYGLVRAGAQVVLANRTHDRAEQVARTVGGRAIRWSELQRALAEIEVVVSTLPPEVDPVPADWLRPSQVVLDANYPGSSLLATAASRGCAVIRGEAWLLEQALPAFRLFTGKEASRSSMERALPGDLESKLTAGNISLIGFMGCGKSTIARRLAEKLGYTFKDTDAVVEARAGKSVPEIFRLEGEQHFRAIEKSVLAEIPRATKTVHACGGGAVLDPANRELLAQSSLVVWLHASLESCLQRVAPGSRPLLAVAEYGERTQARFRSRTPLYAGTADLVVSSEGDPEQTTENIHEEIRRTLGH